MGWLRGMRGSIVGLIAGVAANLGLLYTNFFATCSIACIAPPISTAAVVIAILLIPVAMGHIIYKRIWKKPKTLNKKKGKKK